MVGVDGGTQKYSLPNGRGEGGGATLLGVGQVFVVRVY